MNNQDLVMQSYQTVMEDKIKTLVKELRELAFFTSNTIAPLGPFEKFFYENKTEGGITGNNVIRYVEFKRKCQEISRYATIPMLERILSEYARPQPLIDDHVVAVLDESETVVSIIEEEERIFSEETMALGIYSDKTVVDGALILKQFDSADRQVSAGFLLDTMSLAYPAKVTWTESRDRYCAMVERYTKRVRSSLYQIPSYDRVKVNVALDNINSIHGSMKQVFEVYYVNDRIIKHCFREYVERKVKLMLARMSVVKKKRPKWSALHITQEGSCVKLVSTTRDFGVEWRLWEIWMGYGHPNLEERAYKMLMSYWLYIAHGTSFFSSVPRLLYQYVGTEYDITGELFASPLNVTMPNYYSMGMYDPWFGSKGNFFASEEITGRWFANPPFLIEFIRFFANFLHKKIHSTSPLFTIILFVSEAYSSTTKEVYNFLRSHIFFKGSKSIKAGDSCYDQYCKDSMRIGVSHRYFTRCDTEIMLFTNEQISLGIVEDIIDYWKMISRTCSSLPPPQSNNNNIL